MNGSGALPDFGEQVHAQVQIDDVLAAGWFVQRLWLNLEVPADLACRAVHRGWSCVLHDIPETSSARAACDSQASPRKLLLPHLRIPQTAQRRRLFLRWSYVHTSPISLETLRIPVSLGGSTQGLGVGSVLEELERRVEGNEDLESSSSSSSASLASASIADSDRVRKWQEQGCAAVEDVLCRFAGMGAASWVDWLLRASLAVPLNINSRKSEVCLVADSLGTWMPRGYSALDGGEERMSFAVVKAAASVGHTHVLRVLIRHRADLSASDQDSGTALHWAADQGHGEACELLLSSAANINAQDDDDWTPLCMAAESGHLQASEVLVRFGARLDLADEDSRSPLWWAVWKQQDPVVDFLLRSKASPVQADRNGCSPQEILQQQARLDLQRQSADAGASSSSSRLAVTAASSRHEVHREPQEQEEQEEQEREDDDENLDPSSLPLPQQWLPSPSAATPAPGLMPRTGSRRSRTASD